MTYSRPRRARDPERSALYFATSIWVECPKCKSAAHLMHHPHTKDGEKLCEPRITCTRCSFSSDTEGKGIGLTRNLTYASWRARCSYCGRDMPKITPMTPAHKIQGKLIAKLRCEACQRVSNYPVHQHYRGAADFGHDPYFQQPLYLTTMVGANLLWVYNLEHLDALENWLGATLRERHLGPGWQTMMAKLPLWMKAAGQRSAMLKGFARLRAKAKKADIPT